MKCSRSSKAASVLAIYLHGRKLYVATTAGWLWAVEQKK